MPLTDYKIKSLKADDPKKKHPDSGGLYLYLSPTGGKLWRKDYSFGGVRKTSSFGEYPIVPNHHPQRIDVYRMAQYLPKKFINIIKMLENFVFT